MNASSAPTSGASSPVEPEDEGEEEEEDEEWIVTVQGGCSLRCSLICIVLHLIKLDLT